MEIKIDTEKTVEQIAKKMVQLMTNIWSRYSTLGIRALTTKKDMGTEDILRDDDIQKGLLNYNKLIGLVESVMPMSSIFEVFKAMNIEKNKKESAAILFERLLDELNEADTIGGALGAFHRYVPSIVHRMRAEGIIKEGGENG